MCFERGDALAISVFEKEIFFDVTSKITSANSPKMTSASSPTLREWLERFDCFMSNLKRRPYDNWEEKKFNKCVV